MDWVRPRLMGYWWWMEWDELFWCLSGQPFPVSYQKGWKIHSYMHGHRVWFHFLTFTRAPSGTAGGAHSGAHSAPCIRVFATFDRVRASSQVCTATLWCHWPSSLSASLATYMYTWTHTCMHACIHTHMHTCVRMYTHTHTHARMHARMHVHTHTHTRTPLLKLCRDQNKNLAIPHGEREAWLWLLLSL